MMGEKDLQSKPDKDRRQHVCNWEEEEGKKEEGGKGKTWYYVCVCGALPVNLKRQQWKEEEWR